MCARVQKCPKFIPSTDGCNRPLESSSDRLSTLLKSTGASDAARSNDGEIRTGVLIPVGVARISELTMIEIAKCVDERTILSFDARQGLDVRSVAQRIDGPRCHR